jgi:hypothetical protein
MNLETYDAEFKKLYDKADKLSALYFSNKKDFQIKLSELSVAAVTIYSAHNNYGQLDHELRVQKFLDFDNHLKALKKKFVAPSPAFFSSMSDIDPDENAALLSIKEPSPRVTKRSI